MLTIIKSTLKLLFRNKAFWFFLLFAPAVSILILSLNTTYTMTEDASASHEIVEIKADDKIAYYGGLQAYAVKVYDASGSDMSGMLLNDLAESGMYAVCRASVPGITEAELNEHIESDAYGDRMGAAMYIAPGFDELVSEGNPGDAVQIYVLSDDARTDLLLGDIELTLKQLELTDSTETIADIRSQIPERQINSITGAGERELTQNQKNEKMKLGYTFSIMTFGFVFCGAFISHTAIEEQKNMVLTRIRLTGGKDITYLAAKFICTLLVSCVITAILAAGMIIFNLGSEELDTGKLILLVFLQGIIFSTLTLLIGMAAGEVMTSNFVAFTVWCMSSLFAGLYFPLDDSTPVIKAISYAMPQHWFMEGVEMFFVKDNMIILYILCVTAAYLMIILSIGNVSIKLRRQEA